ncbi:MAG: hypothetical protein AB1768_05935 [Pseudomonadota bacterium]|jgi:hypothetical protein
MTRPTLAARLARKLILMSTDAEAARRVRAALPPGWELVETTDLRSLGDFAAVLLHRFILLDLDEQPAFDPLAALRQVRMEMMLNIPIFCFGGAASRRDEARLARADRFFGRDELEAVLPQLCRQFGWGG